MPKEKRKPTGVFTAQHARNAAKKHEGKKKSDEQEREEKRQARIKSDIEHLPHTLETVWMPEIRKAAIKGENHVDLWLYSDEAEVVRSICKLLRDLGYEVKYYVHRSHGSDDDPGTDRPTLKVSW